MNGEWITRASMPMAVVYHTAIVLADNQTAMICGGHNATAITNQCFYYSSVNDQWTVAPALNQARDVKVSRAASQILLR